MQPLKKWSRSKSISRKSPACSCISITSCNDYFSWALPHGKQGLKIHVSAVRFRPQPFPHHERLWMASVLGFEAYEDFKRVLGPRWAYYLFPVLRGERWDNCLVAVVVIARLLREGFWKEAGSVSRSIESGANVDCSELTVLQPWLSEYVDSVPGVARVLAGQRLPASHGWMIPSN